MSAVVRREEEPAPTPERLEQARQQLADFYEVEPARQDAQDFWGLAAEVSLRLVLITLALAGIAHGLWD